MDIKNDRDAYAKIIGFDKYDTKNVNSTVEYFLSGKSKYEFRTTLINEYHKEENVIKIGEWIKGADKYFLQKFKDSENCIKSNLHPVEDKDAVKFRDILKNYVVNTNLRGYDL